MALSALKHWPTGRWLPGALLAVAALAAMVAVSRLHAAWEEHRANGWMHAGETSRLAPARVVLGHAIALERQGRMEDALAAYAEAEALGSPEIVHAARVNVANLYLRSGIRAATEDGNAPRALVLVQLAKAGLRRALRERPDDWDARYNLELAQRLVPDFETRNWRRSGNEAEVEEALKRDKSAWSEMVGQPRGMH